MERLIVEMQVEGTNFSPNEFAKKYPNFELRSICERDSLSRQGKKINWGSCVITTENANSIDEAINVIAEAVTILREKKELGIENNFIKVFIEDVMQSNFTISSNILKKISELAPHIDFVVLQKES